MTAPVCSKPWSPEYGYRRSDGWRQKVRYGDRWDYPRPAREPPFRGTLLVHPRRAWRTLFFARSLGIEVAVASRHGRTSLIGIDYEVPADMNRDRLRRFVEHVRRSGLADERLGLTSVIGAAGRRRPRRG